MPPGTSATRSAPGSGSTTSGSGATAAAASWSAACPAGARGSTRSSPAGRTANVPSPNLSASSQATSSSSACANTTAVHCSRRSHRRSEEHTSELQSRQYLVCRLLLEKKKDREVGIQADVNKRRERRKCTEGVEIPHSGENTTLISKIMNGSSVSLIQVNTVVRERSGY